MIDKEDSLCILLGFSLFLAILFPVSCLPIYMWVWVFFLMRIVNCLMFNLLSWIFHIEGLEDIQKKSSTKKKIFILQ